MIIQNCTPHIINVVRKDGTIINFPPSGIVPRVSSSTVEVFDLDGIAVVQTEFGEVVDLPPARDGVWLVVSRIVLNAAPKYRDDLLSPGELVRDENGQPKGCKGFSR